jgi:hypothetical protein
VRPGCRHGNRRFLGRRIQTLTSCMAIATRPVGRSGRGQRR